MFLRRNFKSNIKNIRNIITTTPITNNIVRLSLDQSPVNSLNLTLITSLKNKLIELHSSSSTNNNTNTTTTNNTNNNNQYEAIILSSSCRVFSAGLDLNCLYGASNDYLKNFWTEFQDLCFLLYGSNKFIIAEINGHAPAAGTILSLCCDTRVAVNGSKLGLNEAAFGLVCPIWACDMFTSLVGNKVAYKSLCQGLLFSTEESHKIGLIDHVVNDKTALNEQVLSLCNEWIKNPGRGATKTLLRQANLTRWKNERHIDLNEFVTLLEKEETQQRIKLYLQSLKKN